MGIEKLSSIHQELLKYMESSSVGAIFIDPSGQWLSIDFTSNIGHTGIILKLFNLSLLKVSRSLDDEGLYVVGEVSLTPFHDGGGRLLNSLGYGFKNERGETISYSDRTFWHFHLEGDICIDAVCENYEILKTVL
ncbi:MAG TPA: hypothetical protein VI306_15825 [Pyrinomonadaceae bacterium]